MRRLATTYLYGLGPIAECRLLVLRPARMATNTPRQMKYANGEVTPRRTYTPWGDTLASAEPEPFDRLRASSHKAYFGGRHGPPPAACSTWATANTTDPATGRFLNRNVTRTAQSYVLGAAQPHRCAALPPLLYFRSSTTARKKTRQARFVCHFAVLCFGDGMVWQRVMEAV